MSKANNNLIKDAWDTIHINSSRHRIIPMTWIPTKFYSLEFIGLEPSEINSRAEAFYNYFVFLGKAIYLFMDEYTDTHAFTEPQITIDDKGTIRIKIGTMENERYNKLMGERK